MDQRIAITGYHMLTSLGDTEETWSKILNLQSGVKINKKTNLAESYVCKDKYLLENFINKYKYLDDINHMLLYSASKTISMSKILETDCQEDVGVVVGSMNITQQSKEHIISNQLVKNTRSKPKLGTQQLNNSTSAHIAMEYQFHGPNTTVTTACSSGGQAIGLGCDWIRLNKCRAVLVAGVELAPTLNGFIQVYDGMRILARNQYEGPFSKNRKGFALADGVGSLMLENYDSAIERGAKIFGYIEGVSLTTDTINMATPDSEGKWIGKAMSEAIKEAEITANDITFVNAHATATVVGDIAEMRAVKNVFENYDVPIYSSKGNIGHTLGASGAIATIISLLAIRDNVIPPNNTKNIDEKIEANIITRSQFKKVNYVIVNAMGFGGNNVSIVVGSGELS